MAKQCIFCHRRADSKEHIWSQWILDELPEKPGIFTQRFPNGTTRTWPTNKPELTVGIVCERHCNNGWMNAKLEGPMSRLTKDILIRKTKKTFSASDCSSIAAWAYKTAILANHMTKAPEFFTKEERYAFAHNQAIPAGVNIWLAQRNPVHLQARFVSLWDTQQPQMPIMPHLTTLPVHPYRFDLYTCVLSVGYLLLQVAAAKWTNRQVAQTVNFPPIFQGQFFESYSIPIWPIERDFVANWPTPLGVGNDLFEMFCERFKTLNVPRWMVL